MKEEVKEGSCPKCIGNNMVDDNMFYGCMDCGWSDSGNYEKLLGSAIAIASREFEGKYDRGGKPYILHCLWVMNKVRHLGPVYMIVAVLHDLFEYTSLTPLYLEIEGFPPCIIDNLILLTHEDKTYDEYIKLLGESEIAREVKLRDLEHNSKITRLKGVRPKDLERIEKYHKAYLYLKNITT